MAPTARAAFGLPALAATALYVMVLPFGILRTMSRTLSENVFIGPRVARFSELIRPDPLVACCTRCNNRRPFESILVHRWHYWPCLPCIDRDRFSCVPCPLT